MSIIYNNREGPWGLEMLQKNDVSFLTDIQCLQINTRLHK